MGVLTLVGGGLFAITFPLGGWQNLVKGLAAAVITYIIVLWISAVVWVYRDIRERTQDPFFQAIAVFVVLVFNLPGLWVYLILRPQLTLAEAYAHSLEEEALLQELDDQLVCPNCGRRVADDFLICPSCQTQLKEACTVCSKPLSYSWLACPYCASPKRERQPHRAIVDQSTMTMPRAARRPRTADGSLQEGASESPALAREGPDSG